jgi:hypothetical protein
VSAAVVADAGALTQQSACTVLRSTPVPSQGELAPAGQQSRSAMRAQASAGEATQRRPSQITNAIES